MVYVYEEGLVRFATTKYRPPDMDDTGANLNNREGKFCHLTNYSLNKLNKKGFKQGNTEDEMSGSKWSLKLLRKVLRSNGIDDKAIFQKIYDVINKTFLSVDPVLRQAHA
jgi:tubulin polyglutamylase TTLL6/13